MVPPSRTQPEAFQSLKLLALEFKWSLYLQLCGYDCARTSVYGAAVNDLEDLVLGTRADTVSVRLQAGFSGKPAVSISDLLGSVGDIIICNYRIRSTASESTGKTKRSVLAMEN